MYRRYCQTHLESSTEDMLSIRCCRRSSPKRGEAFIFRLPDEILLNIFQYATSDSRAITRTPRCRVCEGTRNYAYTKLLLFVCRRFQRIAGPLLYHTIRFEYPHKVVPPSRLVKRLHSKLRADPSLRQNCRALEISIDDTPSKVQAEDYAIANDLVSWLTGVRCLRIYGGFSEAWNRATWSLIRSMVGNMPEVEHLSITRYGCGLYLGPIMENITFTSLKTLELHGISHTPSTLPKKHRTAPFTALSLSDFKESPEAAAQLVHWPEHLSHFVLDSFYNNHFYMDLSMLHSMLLTHGDTLKVIEIGYLTTAGAGRLFRACDFPNLEHLRLSRWQMDKVLKFSQEQSDALLGGPKLNTFGWDFSIIDQHNESFDAFVEAEEQWLRDFANAAIARKTTLRIIKITFNPEPSGLSIESGEHYPWDRMDRVHDEIRPRGIGLEYSEPPCSKQEWLERPQAPFMGDGELVSREEIIR